MLMLATVLAHALLPIAPPTVKTSGSPFSASTLDVSTAPSRRVVAVEVRQVATDPHTDVAVLLPALLPEVSLPRRAERPMQRGPPSASAPPDETYPSGAALSRAPPLS